MSRIKVSSTSRVILFSTGSFKFHMELDAMDNELHGAKTSGKTKFFTNAKSENDKKAYDLGKELSKE
jgi:hypothetical protein